MTDEPTNTDADAEQPGDPASGSADAAVHEAAAEASAPEPAASPVAAPPRVHWYQRTTGGQTYLDRYLFPAIVPLCSVAVIIFYVVNISRVFLSGKGTIAIVTAAVITVAILSIASGVSAATRMRTQPLTVLTAMALLAVSFGGWIAVGHAQPKNAAAAVACKPVTTKVAVQAEASLHFDKVTFTAKAGCVEFDYGGASGHTLAFDPPGPQAPQLASAAGGGGPTTFAWTFKPGKYTFYCTIPGHRAAGMQATLVVG
jgi:plastocyanin